MVNFCFATNLIDHINSLGGRSLPEFRLLGTLSCHPDLLISPTHQDFLLAVLPDFYDIILLFIYASVPRFVDGEP